MFTLCLSGVTGYPVGHLETRPESPGCPGHSHGLGHLQGSSPGPNLIHRKHTLYTSLTHRQWPNSYLLSNFLCGHRPFTQSCAFFFHPVPQTVGNNTKFSEWFHLSTLFDFPRVETLLTPLLLGWTHLSPSLSLCVCVSVSFSHTHTTHHPRHTHTQSLSEILSNI